MGHNKGFAKPSRNFKKIKSIFDIGAHIGLCSLPLSILAKKIVSFEASPTNIKYLEKHLKINNIFNINVVPYAVGKENNNKIDFYDVGGGSGIPSIANLKIKKNIKINHLKVKQISLDDYVNKNSLFLM